MKIELENKIKQFNKNHKELVTFLETKGMFINGVSSDFKTFPIFKGEYPHSEYVGYANSECEIDSIIWSK